MLPGSLRAVFLKIFALIYIINVFQTSTLVNFEEFITSKNVELGRQVSETFKNMEQLKDNEDNQAFLNSLLANLNNGNNQLALASLKVFNVLIDYGFFEEEYILQIKQSFEQLILSQVESERDDKHQPAVVGTPSASGRGKRASEVLSKRPALPVSEVAKDEKELIVQP